MIRLMAAGLLAFLLTACSPPFDWRQVTFGRDGATGVLPDKPLVQTRELPYGADTVSLTMNSARVRSVLFALGSAPLPDHLAGDAAGREALAARVIESFYRNAGLAPPEPLPRAGQRFTVQGAGPNGPVLIDAEVRVTSRELLEAVVIADPGSYAKAPVNDFWFSLRWAAR